MSELIHIRTIEDSTIVHQDGRLTGRLVPYDSPAWVRDVLADGRMDTYREGFRRGAFDRLLKAGNPKAAAGRVSIRHMHDRADGLGYIGIGREFTERDDGLYGTFQVVQSKRGDVADLTDAGINGLSIEFKDRPGGTVEEDGVRWRTDVLLDGVALEWQGAYSEAQVLAYRSSIEETEADTAAAQAEADAEAERQRAEAEAAEERRVALLRELDELDEFLVEANRKQVEYAERLG